MMTSIFFWHYRNRKRDNYVVLNFFFDLPHSENPGNSKFTVCVKNTFLINLRVMISNIYALPKIPNVDRNYPNKTFLLPHLDIFILSRNFAIGQIWGRLFQIRQYRSLIQAPKVQFLIPNLRIFFFAANFAI